MSQPEDSHPAPATGFAQERVGRYLDEGQLDQGGMSSVHRAFDRQLLRRVAMKVLSPALAASPFEVQRFHSEAKRTAGLDHPHIPPVHELGFDSNGRPYFTMKLVEGTTLLDLLKATSLDPADPGALFHVLQIFLKAAQAVSFAHSRGLVHCDLKPQNIMVGSHGQVYVMDWGIARSLSGADAAQAKSHSSSPIEGTAAYMAPEQAFGQVERIDMRTDVFGLGGVLYRILAGRAPYTGEVSAQLEQARACRIEPPWIAARNPSLPRRLCDIAMKALRADPAERHPSVDALQAEVEAYLRGDVEHATRTFAPGSTIVREGDHGDAAYLIQEGRCRVYKTLASGRHVLGELGPGAVFGETAIFASQPRTASVEAIGEVKATVVTRPLLEQEMHRTYWVGHLVKALAERFRTVNDKVAAQEEEGTFHELAQAILRYMLIKANGQKQVPWMPLKLYLCRTFQRTPPDVTHMVSQLEGFELDLAADVVSLVESAG